MVAQLGLGALGNVGWRLAGRLVGAPAAGGWGAGTDVRARNGY